MLSRRLIRIKTLQALYSYKQQESDQVQRGKEQLLEQLFRFEAFYLFLLQFPAAFRDFLNSTAELERQKFFPDKERIRECMVLNSNSLAGLMEETVAKSGRNSNFNWDQAAESFDRVWSELKEQEFVRDYLVFEKPDFSMQREFLLQLYDYLMNASEFFNDLMEEQYPAWYDDEQQLWRVVYKTLEAAKEEDLPLAAPMRKTDDEIEFSCELFALVCNREAEFESHIKKASSNWDTERIALVDMIIMKMAIAEFLHFPHIPPKVSINEYLEIAKEYSTPNSSRFINGILDKLRISLQEDGLMRKIGRGLREN
ncbi:MAG: transcription antitermination factor NusB [Bacteroidetes bacterium]|nr:transcription antitermination factor NusB [Bacteroidota bacterium]